MATGDDPKLDLSIERVVPVPRSHVWRCWTEPELLKRWFCPKPWRTIDCRIDLRPGGEFYTVMRGPDGEENAGTGVFLVVEPERELIFTDALLPGWRPSAKPFMTGFLRLAERNGGTLYTAGALHATEETRENHEKMGFQAGWNAALDQLVEVAEGLR